MAKALNSRELVSVVPLAIFFEKLFAGCILEENTDYVGHSIGFKTVSALLDCANFCASTVGGLFWTYTRENDLCNVKSSSAGERPDPNAVSGNRACGVTGDRVHPQCFPTFSTLG